jgi:dolichyl-phosphate-mannose-protein mannosyltransferase
MTKRHRERGARTNAGGRDHPPGREPAPPVVPTPAPAPASRTVLVLLGALLLAALALRVARLDRPRALVLDELYYVNAARVILDLPRPADDPWAWHPTGLDPNVEHPPGGKLLLAASMRALGDNPWGWRLPGALAGALAILLLYLIGRRAGLAAEAALLAAFAFAFDDLVFLHARVGMLDGPQLALLLLGVWAYLAGRPVLAGLALVASALCKITGLYGLAALVGLEALRLVAARRAGAAFRLAALRPLAVTAAVFVVGVPLGLGALDLPWGIFKNPFEHLRYVFSYGYTLTDAGTSQAAPSAPWEWLLNRVPMLYYRAPGATVHAAMNPLVVFATLPAVAYAVVAAVRRRDQVAFVVLALFAATWLPFLPAAAAGRISYLYYFLPALPAVALGAAALVAAGRARVLPWLYAAAVLAGFVWRFPYRGGQ